MLISLYVCVGVSEISFSCSFFKAELSQQIKGTVTKSLRYRFLGHVHTKPVFFFLKPHICCTNSTWMNEPIHWFSVDGRPIRVKICGFKKIRTRVDGAFCTICTLYKEANTSRVWDIFSVPLVIFFLVSFCFCFECFLLFIFVFCHVFFFETLISGYYYYSGVIGWGFCDIWIIKA